MGNIFSVVLSTKAEWSLSYNGGLEGSRRQFKLGNWSQVMDSEEAKTSRLVVA